MTTADLYLRLSDFRDEDNGGGFAGREAQLRARAGELGWTVGRVVIENDLMPAGANGNGRARPALAFKRRKIITPSGRTELRVIRPGFRSVLDDLVTGRAAAVLAEDLDRAVRDPRDLEDLIDAIAACRGQARSLSGSLTLTDGGTDSEVTMARVMVTMGNKSSRDTGRRVAGTRARTAADGAYGGGLRPFGYRPDPDAPKYAKTLIIVPSEAAELRAAAAAVLAVPPGAPATSGPLKGLARDLRDRKVPTVTGAAWSAETLTGILLKPAIAGISVHTAPDGTRTEHAATWPAIIERDEWEALRAILTDPARRTSTGNAPKWLGSGIYRCGKCNDGTSVHVTGGRDHAPAYVCEKRSHLRRVAVATDEYVSAVIIERLSREDARDLLAPAPRPGIDAAALRREAATLTAIGERQARMHAVGDLTDAEMTAGSRARKARLDQIGAGLAAGTAPDPLAEFRGQADPAAVWHGLPLARKRGVLAVLATVTLLPSTRRGRGFDPDSVRVEPVQP